MAEVRLHRYYDRDAHVIEVEGKLTELSDLIDASSGGAPAWGAITGTIPSQTDLQSALDAKQDDLVSGTNIKTVNGTSLLGSGDVVISGGSTIKEATATVASSNGGRFEHTETIVDIDVSGTSKLTVSLGNMADTDENDAELLDIAGMTCVPGTGQFTVKMAFLTRTSGPIKFNYMIGA